MTSSGDHVVPESRSGRGGPAVDSRDGHVTVVDDDPLARDELSRALLDRGYPVGSVSPSVEGIPFGSGAHMVVCDLHLPGRSGVHAVEYLIEHGCTVLATSSAATEREILDAVSVGARGFSAKTAPVAPSGPSSRTAPRRPRLRGPFARPAVARQRPAMASARGRDRIVREGNTS
ncbi:MAG: response regulator [Thermoplasmata archaeon]